MSCLGDCWDVGPPPDTILFMPPPPIPAFMQGALPELLFNSTSCMSPQLCEAFPAHGNRVPGDGIGGEFIEMPRKDVENWSPTIGDTWLLVLVASAIGVLLLGALLAMFLLKCREMNMFGSNDCSMHNRQIKNHEPIRDCTNVPNINSNKLVHPSETVLYHGNGNIHTDNRMVWAALTPRGTQHFISENYPSDLVDYIEADDHYETIEHLNIQPAPPVHYSPYYQRKDYEYEDPTPLIESYQLNDMERQVDHQYAAVLAAAAAAGGGGGGNTDMRCASMRRLPAAQAQHYRPRVSSPTRIEHPNLPPLNLYPHNTLNKKQSNGGGTLSYRTGDTMTLPKYGI